MADDQGRARGVGYYDITTVCRSTADLVGRAASGTARILPTSNSKLFPHGAAQLMIGLAQYPGTLLWGACNG